MNLEELQGRHKEIEVAIINMTAQLNHLHGHKTEVAYWISQLHAASPESTETQVECCQEPVLE